MVELGHIDTCLKVSLLSSHIALLCTNHLKHILQIFGYLNIHHNAEIVFDQSDPVINVSEYEVEHWTASEFDHVQGKEKLPPNALEPREYGFTMKAKVDADHVSETVT